MRTLLGAALLVGCGGAGSVPADSPEGPSRSPKRGVAYHFCGMQQARGVADLAPMQDAISWTYNWAERPHACGDGPSVEGALAEAGVEFVPMAWGLVDGGAACDEGGPCLRVDNPAGPDACADACAGGAAGAGGPEGACWACFHQPVTREAFTAAIPEGARWLLGFNEPNFHEQANLTPAEAARGWVHLERVADERGLGLVGPATNFCSTDPDAPPAAHCIEAQDGVEMVHLAWLEAFYDECSAEGAAGHDCRIDHQATHTYDCHAVAWAVDLFEVKAGLRPSPEESCSNGVQDGPESGVDCGGNFCRACSEHARAMFAKPVWLTEFAHAPWGGCEDRTPEQLLPLAMSFVREQIPLLEAHPRLYRYAWFMPKVRGAPLDHDDLLVEDAVGERTPLGELYLGAPY